MHTNNNHYPLREQSISGDSLVVVGNGFAAADAQWPGGTPAPPEILNGGLDPVWLLHCLRRHWILAAGLGLLAGAATAMLVWLLIPAKASATRYLKVNERKPYVAFQVDEGGETDFKTYRGTLVSLFTTPGVLRAALRPQEIQTLPTMQAIPLVEQMNWLRSNLLVGFEKNAELMVISMEGAAADDMKALVDATTEAFLEEIIYKERQSRLQVKAALEKSYQKTISEIEEKTQRYNRLAMEYNTKESPYAQVDRAAAFNELSLMRTEREHVEYDLIEQRLKEMVLKSQRDDPVLFNARVSKLLLEDPQVAVLQEQLNNLDLIIAEERTRAKRNDAPSLVRLLTRRRTIENQIAQRQSQLRPQLEFQLQNTPDAEFSASLKSAALRQAFLEAHRQKLDTDIKDMTGEIKKLGERSLELESLQFDIDQLRKVANSMGNKIEAWEIELQSPERVTKVDENAEVQQGLNRLQRGVLIGFSGLFGLGLTCFGIALWDFQFRRLNGAGQIGEGLGIRVVGQLPPLVGNGKRDATGPRVAMLLESIDSVRTALIHTNGDQPAQVVMITSASGHEGSTTVASQLAASLARAGKRTLLVDGDLRHPTLHSMFGTPLSDGFCEALRGEAMASDVVQPTQAEGLWLLGAGQCDAASIQALAREKAGPIFDALRNEFDFVIIDSAPVLNLADSLILGQYTDGAILAVLRDASQVPQVHAATERLTSVGIRILGAVINGVPQAADERASRLLQATGGIESSS